MTPVTDLLWRGPRPRSLHDLKAADFRVVIDLQSGVEDALTESPYEHEDPRDFNMHRIDFNWSNICPPTRQQVAYALTDIRIQCGMGYKTYVHCHSGVDRTGFLIAVFRMQEQNWNFERAHEEWVQQGRHWWFAWWKYELKKWAWVV